MGQVWGINSLGGFLYSDELSTTLRHAVQPMMRFRQLCDARDASKKAKHKGDLFHWDVFSNISTQGTTLAETNTMPERDFTITQGTLTVTEGGNSVPYSEKLDNLSALPVKEIINKVLKNDAAKFFDTQAYNEFNKTPLVMYPTATDSVSLTTNSTFGGTASNSMRKQNVAYISDLMKERNIPAYFNGEDYGCIAHPTTISTVKDGLESVFQYTEQGFTKIMRGEIGRYRNVRFIEQTQIAKATSGYTNTNWAFFFGADTVTEGIVVPEEMRGKIPTDYGRSKGVAWYYLGGFGIVHNSTDTAQARIIKWGGL
jgi:N4-gp56 family major capsid protein